MPITPRAVPSLLALAASLALASCNSRQPDELAQAIAVGERPVAMAGSENFFDNSVTATVTISRGIGRGTEAGHHGGDKAKILSLEGMDKDEAAAYIVAKNNIGSPLPPVTLHLKFRNLLQATISVEILDFDSDLGNFAVTPSSVTIEPGQVAEPDPMVSQLGVTSDQIPVKVRLKMADRKETRTILVKALPQVAPAK